MDDSGKRIKDFADRWRKFDFRKKMGGFWQWQRKNRKIIRQRDSHIRK